MHRDQAEIFVRALAGEAREVLTQALADWMARTEASVPGVHEYAIAAAMREAWAMARELGEELRDPDAARSVLALRRRDDVSAIVRRGADLAGWVLALWCPREPSAARRAQRAGEPSLEVDELAILAWHREERDDAHWVALPIDVLAEHPELIERGQEVLHASPSLPPGVLARLRQELGYDLRDAVP